jgi:hypothetical protein
MPRVWPPRAQKPAKNEAAMPSRQSSNQTLPAGTARPRRAARTTSVKHTLSAAITSKS